MNSYRNVLLKSKVFEIIDQLRELEGLEDVYKHDSYMSKQIQEATQAIEDIENAIELLVDLEFNIANYEGIE